ncbi:enoyl-CoA hydratase/isomerase family protein [Kitasatospora sp. CM 4170]|uniref:Enoyl-CoA hydratase/isomerase family protein n=1 Tax=Kitasatospora aburaviensis TaxID=67265 RepID=A0ABW1FA99_9ACTN|nr:enoyl-CoA hydratase/isomerase family protein [Kitasatospora sp. CM 4170]WNM48011.1 enoyl-CoA hydratase/isomerase family protein [Kitasatospora sp. CM 4170]
MDDQPLLTRGRSPLPTHVDGLNAWTGEDGVAVLEFARPHRRNAITLAIWQALPKVLQQLAEQPDVRALLVTGAGGTFSAGADIAELSEVYGDPDRADAYHATNVAAEEALAAFPHPTIAVVRGACVGGGCQLAVACDLRFVAENARMGITPAKLGVVYPAVPTLRLARLVGPARAKLLLFSGELVTGRENVVLGLAERALPDAELDAGALEFARLLTLRSPQTIGAVKAALAVPPERAAEALRPWESRSREASDTHEGLAAFLEGRPPRF